MDKQMYKRVETSQKTSIIKATITHLKNIVEEITNSQFKIRFDVA